jgi:hypothetical protein
LYNVDATIAELRAPFPIHPVDFAVLRVDRTEVDRRVHLAIPRLRLLQISQNLLTLGASIWEHVSVCDSQTIMSNLPEKLPVM